MSSSLTNAQSAAYWEDGFLFPLRVLAASQAHEYRVRLERLEKVYVNPGRAAELPRPLADYKRVHAEVVMPMAAELALNTAVLDAVEGIIGPNLLVWGAEFFIKEPHSPQHVSMHQDLTYWGFGATSNQVTAWIALSPSNMESGCMDLVKGSHKNEILPHNDTHAAENLLSRGQEVAVEVRQSDRTHVVLQPGEMSLHHGLAIHGSNPNLSDDRRIGFAIRYINPDATQQTVEREYAMLARGVDRSQSFIHYSAPQELFSPMHLKLYEEIREQQARVLGAGMRGDKQLYNSSAST